MSDDPETPRSNVAALDVILSSQLSEPLYEEAMSIVARLESQNQALQERIEKAREYVTENGAVMMNTPATWRRFVDEILQLLSSTQETDPE